MEVRSLSSRVPTAARRLLSLCRDIRRWWPNPRMRSGTDALCPYDFLIEFSWKARRAFRIVAQSRSRNGRYRSNGWHLDVMNGTHLALAVAAALVACRPAIAIPDDELLKQAQQLFAPLPKDMATPEFPVTKDRVTLGRALFFDT